jgi:hypothetical protein
MKKTFFIYLFVILCCSITFVFCMNDVEVYAVKLKESVGRSGFSDNSDEELRRRIGESSSISWALPMRIELIRRGDLQEKARLLVSLHSQDRVEQYDALRGMKMLANKEAIYHLGEMLNNPRLGGRPAPWIESDGSKTHSDEIYLAPSKVAAAILTDLLKAPPLRKNSEYTDEEMKVWREWWQQVRPQFSEFFPNDEK